MSKFAPHRKSANNPRATSSTICQKCLGTGHYTYQCNKQRPYISRPSRTQQLENPRVLAKLKTEGKPSVEVPEEFRKKSGTANKILEEKEKERAKEKQKEGGPSRKRTKRSSSPSTSSSDSSDSESDSESDSDSDSSSGSSSSHDSHHSSIDSRIHSKKRRASRSPSNNSDRGRQRRRSPSTDSREEGGSRR